MEEGGETGWGEEITRGDKDERTARVTESGVMCRIQEVRDLPERRGKGSEERMRERLVTCPEGEGSEVSVDRGNTRGN